MPRNLSPAVLAAIDAPQKTMGLFLELNFENALTPLTPGAAPDFAIVSVSTSTSVLGSITVHSLFVVVQGVLTTAQESLVSAAANISFQGLSFATWLNGLSFPQNSVSVGFIAGPGGNTTLTFLVGSTAGIPANYPSTADSGTVLATSIADAAYDMLDWMLMSPALAAANHLASTGLDGITPANHLYTQLNAGNFYWIKGDAGSPYDIDIFDNTYIYLSATENSWTDAHTAKRFESLNAAIGLKGVPFAKRLMNIGDVVLSADTRFGIYTACGVATYSNLGKAKCTLVGPFVETISGAGGNLPANLTTIHLQYEWSLDVNYNHQAGSVRETYTFCQPYGLVRWQSQNWNVSTGAYDPPNNATNLNILTPGVTGLPFNDPCGFGTNGGGALNISGGTSSGGATETQSTTSAIALWSGIGPMSSLGPAWDPGATFPYGQVFIGMGWLGRIESVPQNSELTAENTTLQLSGIPVNLLGDVVNTVRLSGTAALWLGFFSSTGQLLADPLAMWYGALDVPTVSDGAETCTISITVENALLALNLSSNRRFTTLDQQLDFPGDTGFDYVSAMQDLFLPYPCQIVTNNGILPDSSNLSQAPDVTNALTVSPPGPLKLHVGGTLQVTASAFFVSGPYINTSQPVASAGLWSSSDTGVAIASNGHSANASLGSGNWGTGGGLITATGIGNCTITFFFGLVSCSITVTVLP